MYYILSSSHSMRFFHSQIIFFQYLSQNSKNELRKRHLVTSKSKLAEEDESDNSDFDANEDVCLTKKDEGFYPVKGQPGMFYKVHQRGTRRMHIFTV